MEFFSRNGALIYNDQRFFLKGCSWFGGETDTRCPQGLWAHSVEWFLNFLIYNRFNAVRLQLTAELMLSFDTTQPTSIDYNQNKALEGKSAGEVYDYIVAECAKRGILVVFDMHCLTCKDAITQLWYTPDFPEGKLIHAWCMLASRYQHAWNVIGADIKNEPWGEASWGDGNPATDWKLAAQRIGNAVLSVNPKLLIFVEGTTGNQKPRESAFGAFWGGSLSSASENPVQLSVPDKLVYSPHVYGPGIYMQEYFKDNTFPNNMPAIWTEQWGHLLHRPKSGPAVVIGEWGGFFKDGTLERTWLEAFMSYLLFTGATDHFYWCLNPNSHDTGGLLEDDWTTPVTYKLKMLHKLCEHPSRIVVDKQARPLLPCSAPPSLGGPQKSGWPLQPMIQSVFGKGDPGQQGNPKLAKGASQSLLHGMVVDSSSLPALPGTVSMLNQWQDEEKGWQCQIDGRFRNVSSDAIPNFLVEIVPRGKCLQLWNLKEVEKGRLYTMMDYWGSKGGLQPSEEVTWGGIFCSPYITFLLSPRD